MQNDNQEHLPLYGVGPVIVFNQFVITIGAVLVTELLKWDFARFEILNLPFMILGILCIIFGLYLDISAKRKSKLFEKVAKNELVTDGVYAIVRNPVYSGVMIICTGIVLLYNNLILLIVPVICWGYITIFLINTEEKWLSDLYGQEYTDYCKRVNRCIPWFPGRKEK